MGQMATYVNKLYMKTMSLIADKLPNNSKPAEDKQIDRNSPQDDDSNNRKPDKRSPPSKCQQLDAPNASTHGSTSFEPTPILNEVGECENTAVRKMENFDKLDTTSSPPSKRHQPDASNESTQDPTFFDPTGSNLNKLK